MTGSYLVGARRRLGLAENQRPSRARNGSQPHPHIPSNTFSHRSTNSTYCGIAGTCSWSVESESEAVMSQGERSKDSGRYVAMFDGRTRNLLQVRSSGVSLLLPATDERKQQGTGQPAFTARNFAVTVPMAKEAG